MEEELRRFSEVNKIMGISASIFRKDEYVTERDLDAIIDIFVEMEFYASDKSKDKESNVWSVSFVNDHW